MADGTKKHTKALKFGRVLGSQKLLPAGQLFVATPRVATGNV